MLLRSIARLLVMVMLMASGRLLACGWECIDELAVPAEASCHQESTPVTAVNGATAHACLPEVVEPRVTVAKPATGQMFAAAPLGQAIAINDGPASTLRHRRIPSAEPFQPPHPAIASCLRI